MPKPWSLHWFKGVLLLTDSRAISLDPIVPRAGGDIIFISHAHGDHVAGFRSAKPKMTTAPTLDLYEAKYEKEVTHVLPAFFQSQHTCIDDVAVDVHDAGHILGSAQFRFSHGDCSTTYTGDLNCEKTLVTDPAAISESDELIIDATFGHPDIKFPPRQTLYTEIVHWSWEMLCEGRIPVFFAYEVGKAQELVRLFNKYSGVDVVVEDSMHSIAAVYERHGIPLHCIPRTSREGHELLKRGDCVLIVPARTTLEAVRHYGDAATAVTTGWSLLYNFRAFDKAFPLSSHCDFDHLLEFTKGSRAKKVYPFGSYAKEFSQWLKKKRGIEASPLYYSREKES